MTRQAFSLPPTLPSPQEAPADLLGRLAYRPRSLDWPHDLQALWEAAQQLRSACAILEAAALRQRYNCPQLGDLAQLVCQSWLVLEAAAVPLLTTQTQPADPALSDL